MDVRPNPITLTVADYCQMYRRNEVLVDRKYQRNARVWPARAQSYLIETILRGFPMPKLTLHQQTDVKSRRSIRYVVDGQQRTNAIVEFFDGALRLSRGLELESARGKTFDGLEHDLQEAFLSYPLQFDQFEAVDEDVVREYFRRINSFTVPLNPEERRNANFQGNMKWLIMRLAERHTEQLLHLGTLSEQQVVRMLDHKLLAEIVHALLQGVRTTNSRMLDGMYRSYEKTALEDEGRVLSAVTDGFDQIMLWHDIHLTGLAQRTHIFYSLLLAAIAIRQGWPTLESAAGDASRRGIHEAAEDNLFELGEAVDAGQERGAFGEFVRACTSKTNTKDQRETRIRWISNAITQGEW